MDRKIEELITMFEKDGIEVKKDDVDKINYMDGLGPAIQKLLPDRFFYYDSEVVDDISGYIYVLSQHVEYAQPEWSLSDLNVSGDIDGKVKIEFTHNDKKVSWDFDQDGSDYVSEDFYKRLDNWVSRNLSGKFVMLQTGGQDVAFVYLPKITASKLQVLLKKFIGIDEYVDFFRTSDQDPPNEIYDLRDNPSFDHCAVDSKGETALTAAIKAKNITQAITMMGCDFARITDKNRLGESPLHLARELLPQDTATELVQIIEGVLVNTAQSWSELSAPLEYQKEKFGLYELSKIIKNDKDLQSTFQCIQFMNGFCFSRSELIEVGNDTLCVESLSPIHRTEESKAFNVTYSSPVGTYDDYKLKNITLDEAYGCIRKFYWVD
jgi:hypothetical protein